MTAEVTAPGPVIAEVPVPAVEKKEVEVKIEEKVEENKLPFDPAQLKAKYLEERDKRLRAQKKEGTDQYISVDGQFEHYLIDPWVEPGFTRDPIEEEVDVVIIGGGYGAQVMSVRLLEAGVTNFRIIEKAGDFGGTWYWNRYPGAQCDIESYIYMPLLEEVGYMPTEKYARAKELLKHSRMIGEKFDLYSRALFQTEVKEMRWDDEAAMWTTSTSRNDRIRSRFVIPAAGPLHRPKLPGIDGIADFKGHSFHSSRWDYKYTGGDSAGGLVNLKDKRVGIIGTGATAVQIVPHLGEWAKQLYVFQRTPSSIDVRANKPTDEAWASKLEPGWQRKRMANFDSVVNGGIEEEDMVADRWTDILRFIVARAEPGEVMDLETLAARRQIADFEKMNQIRERVDSIVKNKETADALKPWYNQFCKRPCFHDEYLDTFNRENVTLVDTRGNGVDRITEKGVVANGQEYEIDVLIWATGFELATDWTHRTGFEIYGRNGLTITEKWKEGAATLHGWCTNGFPNCLIVQVVQAALTPNFMHVTAEQARHFAYVIAETQKRGIRSFEPSRAAEEEWTDVIVKGAMMRGDFFKECTPGYYNNEGKPTIFGARNATYGGGSPAFIKILTDWRDSGRLEGLEVRYEEGKQPQKSEEASNGVEKTEEQSTQEVLKGEEQKTEDAPKVNGDAAQVNGATAQVNGDATQEAPKSEPQATEEAPKVNGDTAQQDDIIKAVREISKNVPLPPTGEARPLVQKYADLQAKHQAEMNDLLRKQKAEVVRLLADHGPQGGSV
ncbi:FAD/NAD(P)-binding domain-containing protein [Sporormia fimetaria CBS 119925]|uniref:FAD/NAD(P)-binding domain-containing protein n=1 Tax=Sporormia fimetaria CBS 119925 TaxID=1340428 RepID=A0A6A6VBY9_9PLEO|nr:FAD/NAD(P)-binding domain-containing protein [Sporormia fimetaria CBS 119925]